ncbi:MAG: L,D-transpeptidase, partial [Planctomycetes bacterium]|nr:L,D-transpeptidase [Planctomycetota bacterium]
MSARGDWRGLDYIVAKNESLELIRKRVVRQNQGLLMCTGLIREVNGVGKYIHPGDRLRIPTSPISMLVDLDARMAFYRHGSEVVMAWSVGIGREGHSTPVGSFTVGDKLKEPVWTRRGKPPLPYGHPENLLGSRWLGWYLDGVKTDYGFHGTNDPDGVGGRVSSG